MCFFYSYHLIGSLNIKWNLSPIKRYIIENWCVKLWWHKSFFFFFWERMTQTDKSLYSKNTIINYYRLNSKSININFFHFILYYFMSLFIFQFIPYNRITMSFITWWTFTTYQICPQVWNTKKNTLVVLHHCIFKSLYKVQSHQAHT